MANSMAANVRQALQALEKERTRLDEQIAALQRVLALAAVESAPPRRATAPLAPTQRKRRGMSAKARQAARERMKAYWAKRKAAKGKKAVAK